MYNEIMFNLDVANSQFRRVYMFSSGNSNTEVDSGEFAYFVKVVLK